MDETFRAKIAGALAAAYPDRADAMLLEIERWFAQDAAGTRLCSICGQEKFPQVLFYRGSTEFHGGGRVTPPKMYFERGAEEAAARAERLAREAAIREERRREREAARAAATPGEGGDEDDEVYYEDDDFAPAAWTPPVPNARLCEPCSRATPKPPADAVMLVREAARALRAADDSAEWVVQALERRVFGTDCPLCDAHVESLLRGRGVDLCSDCFTRGADFLKAGKAGDVPD